LLLPELLKEVAGMMINALKLQWKIVKKKDISDAGDYEIL